MLAVVIPFKPLPDAKSRLSTVLSPLERAKLARRMLLHVIDAAGSATGVEEIVVVTPEPDVAAIVAGRDVRLLQEARPKGLNAAARFASAELAAAGGRRILYLPADLPRIGAKHIDSLIEAHRRTGADTIVPSADGSGTNALVIELPPRFQFAFGPDSFNRHLANAARSMRRLDVHRCAYIGVDIDEPDDLRHLPCGMVA